MTREEILSIAKPILFDADMTIAILEERKTATRRTVKQDIWEDFVCERGKVVNYYDQKLNILSNPICKAPYKTGDYLYIQETWMVQAAKRYDALVRIKYRAGGQNTTIHFPYGGTDSINRDAYDDFVSKWILDRWHPSIHMPKEAARIFLRVTNIRVEQLCDITDSDCEKEGIRAWNKDGKLWKYAPADEEGNSPIWEWKDTPRTPKEAMQRIWNSTISKKELDKYGWDANPWTWIIEFERVKPD